MNFFYTNIKKKTTKNFKYWTGYFLVEKHVVDCAWCSEHEIRFISKFLWDTCCYYQRQGRSRDFPLHLTACQKFEQIQLTSGFWYFFFLAVPGKIGAGSLMSLSYTLTQKHYMKHNIKISEIQTVLNISEKYNAFTKPMAVSFQMKSGIFGQN